MSHRAEKGQALDPESAEYAHQVTERPRAALGEKLVGVYLHGSAALGDFLRGQSDIDVVAVSDGPLTDQEAGAVVERLSSESLPCPARGLELHVVDRNTLEEALDPPPFELHIATTRSAGPDRVVAGPGRGGDPDLVMHFAVLREHGVALLGPPATDIFPPVARTRLVRAFASELRWALEHASPTYQVLNACRAWRFSEENVLSSKLSGGEWARERVEHPLLIDAAIENRRGQRDAQPKAADAKAFVETVVELLEQS
jgi:predicted nucleotidyltransferase